VVVLGRTGIGKSWTVHRTLGPTHIELTSEILKSKHDTTEFLEKIRTSDLPVILDDYECVQDLVGLRELTGPPTRGLFVVTSQVLPKFDFEFQVFDFPVPTFEEIKVMVPAATDEAIRRARGDVRQVEQSTHFSSDWRDQFQGPRDFVTSLVSTSSNANPAHFVGEPIQEPGNIASILQQNYVDVPKCKPETLASVADYFSQADIIEDRVYAGDWDLLPLFNLYGCILPAVKIGHTLKEPLKPGATWTKYQNMCMRTKKIQAMATRVPGKRLDLDHLLLLRDYAEAGDVATLREYGLLPQDLDVLNHLSPFRKIKAKTLAGLKKSLTA
jgi:hypothetical protein